MPEITDLQNLAKEEKFDEAEIIARNQKIIDSFINYVKSNLY